MSGRPKGGFDRTAHYLERTARGRADAKEKGVKFGRKPTLTPHQQKEARQRLALSLISET